MEKLEFINNSKQTILRDVRNKNNILLLNIYGEIEGHENLGSTSKKTSYDELLPILAYAQADNDISGVMVLLNTLGGDVEAGLAIAEMIASLDKPTVSLVLGGSHSIGVPLSVSCDRTFIAPTATMIVHPIRMHGMVLGVTQNYAYIERMQDRIISFTVSHSGIDEKSLRNIMFNTKELTKDIGSVLIGKQAVEKKIIDSVGGFAVALNSLYDLIYKRNNSKM
ncbi:MAG: ATP-dependent Clp protease proteolytic subunit [Lachnospiraceae bacterium]|nr:ATP-dependent Clp protease proteolytic subunit [Lachnospiraceae bacterium]